jgi:hypothetical protein
MTRIVGWRPILIPPAKHIFLSPRIVYISVALRLQPIFDWIDGSLYPTPIDFAGNGFVLERPPEVKMPTS